MQRQPCLIYSRVVGYMQPTNQWNDSKEQEFKNRKTFKYGITIGQKSLKYDRYLINKII